MATAAPQLIQTQSPAPGQSVSVWKEIGGPAQGVVYRKAWQCQPGPAAKAWLSWAHHEHLLLTLLAHRDTPHVVQVAGLQVHPDRVEVVTVDAGLDFQRDWLDRAATQGVALVSQPADALKLARAGLVALLGLHKIGVMHGDIKSDNLCIQASPTPEAVGLTLDLQSLRWIDFAYAICREQPLKFVLPTDPDRLAYLPDHFRQAIREAQTLGDPQHIQRAACAQVDLFAWVCMLKSAVPAPSKVGPWALWHEWLSRCEACSLTPVSVSTAFEAPTQQMLAAAEQALETLAVPSSQWAYIQTPLRVLSGAMETPLHSALPTPMLTPLVQMPAALVSLPPAAMAASGEARASRFERVGPRLRSGGSVLLLALVFGWIDQRFVQMNLPLNDLGFALGLMAMVLAMPTLAGAAWQMVSPSPGGRAWLNYSEFLLCGIAAYFLVFLLLAGVPVAQIAGAFFVVTLTLLASWV